MAKAKYKITKEDSLKAWLYIEGKLSDQNHPDEEFNFENKEEFQNIQPNANSKINKWCEKHLNKKQWQQLKDSIQEKHPNQNLSGWLYHEFWQLMRGRVVAV